MGSPFLHPGPATRSKNLAILYMSRDNLTPVQLDANSDINDHGYAEGNVVNTRFGSFPHSTLLDMPWGSQVGASKVDTGSRGRRKAGQKRKLAELKTEDADSSEGTMVAKKALAADSGYVHILQPTPETWTASLPHRTQVVYTPDYSYILHRLRARPGSSIIEAGAGSGAFTHAAARAVFNGYDTGLKKKKGQVWSFEFHQQRAEKLRKEISAHGLDEVVHLTHRDVCSDGFKAENPVVDSGNTEQHVSPLAEAVFLDLPAPWLALPHLSRPSGDVSDRASFSPLSPDSAVHLCTFSPCIEQVTKTVAAMRQLGWVDIDLVELAHKRIDVRREFFGSQASEGDIAVQNVDDAVERLKMVEERLRAYHAKQGGQPGDDDYIKDEPDSEEEKKAFEATKPLSNGGKQLTKNYMLVHQPEPEIKTHTSYLVFAILPRQWTAEDEAKARAEWPVVHREKK